jgi:hypothetical protein
LLLWSYTFANIVVVTALSTNRLCGYPPFYADNAPALFKKIMDVKYDFDDSSWDDVSEDGMETCSTGR